MTPRRRSDAAPGRPTRWLRRGVLAACAATALTGARAQHAGAGGVAPVAGPAGAAAPAPAPASASAPASAASAPLRVLVAGSLRAVFGPLIADWQHSHPGQAVELVAGPSGMLRQRIEAGERWDLYAAAAWSHADAVARAGLGHPAVVFARNRLCALLPAAARSADGQPLTPQRLVDHLLQPGLRIATSTPIADPAGDYTWLFFQRLELQRPGAYAALSARASTVFGGAVPDPRQPPPTPAAVVAEGRFGAAISYCSGTASLPPTLQAVALPDPAPLADYGLTLARSAGPAAAALAWSVLAPAGQQRLLQHGFEAPAQRAP